ncbi:myeloid-associated differentiation marker-like protein 2 [Protopterus annectens]|uniref:myeloid-associated differentiation marker-like protein 2 n=1 Tax=Protopterus annectens TaxID=7888 RepID=UPI001CFAE953|nr:myeloid-associated differentiation marker-like protein 2 [Protopterus annectens]
MATTSGPYVNVQAVASPVGIVRLLQTAFGCTTFSLVAHQAGFSAAYGTFCMFVWCFCFAVTTFIIFCEFTHLHSCLSISWDNFTVFFSMLATLMSVTASVIYPVYFVQLNCSNISCETRNFRIAVSVFSALTAIVYAIEVFLTKAKPGHIASYMATIPGLLKVVQAFLACIIFGALVNQSQYNRYGATQWCVAVYSICFIVTVVIIFLNVAGRTMMVRCPFDRFVVIYTFLAILMYMSAAVIWPVFCFDSKYGSPQRPSHCSKGNCPWDSQLVVAIFTYINLVLYILDLIYSQRIRFITPT